MKFAWIAVLTCVTAFLTAASAEESLAPGQVSSEASGVPADGKVPEPYQDALPVETTTAPSVTAVPAPHTTPEVEGASRSPSVPGLVTDGGVRFVNDRYDFVFMRTRLLNGNVQNIRIGRGQTYLAPTRGEPAICVCWNNLKPVYRCLSPDPVAVPVDSVFRFGQPGNFKYCTASF